MSKKSKTKKKSRVQMEDSAQQQRVAIANLQRDLIAQLNAELAAHADPEMCYGAVWHVEGTWGSERSPRSQRMLQKFYAEANKLRRMVDRIKKLQQED